MTKMTETNDISFYPLPSWSREDEDIQDCLQTKKPKKQRSLISSKRRKRIRLGSSNGYFTSLLTLSSTLLLVALLGFSFCFTETAAEYYTPPNADTGPPVNGLCKNKFIRNTVEEMGKSLKGCSVIEGSLQLALIEGNSSDFRNISFPELREITGYLVVFMVKGIESLSSVFPNLNVIRGQELTHNFALLLQSNPDMKELGLRSLTTIQRGGVWINNNPNLCHAEEIDWINVVNQSFIPIQGIHNNKPKEECPNYDEICLNSQCQGHKRFCSGCGDSACFINGEGVSQCCADQCLGGCNGTSPEDCFVCKNVEFNKKCLSECPSNTYKYLDRRCISAQDCWNMEIPDVYASGKKLKGKILNGNVTHCVMDCPKEYLELKIDGKDYCDKCKVNCTKVCPGLKVDSIQAVQKLKGCTRIQGALKIQIRGYTPNLAAELQSNLDLIEEIDEHLIIAYSYSLFTLDFFKKLKYIHGKKLEENRYALVVKSNENIQELWTNQHVEITNKNAKVLFHYNPKLCPNKIWEFVKNAKIKKPEDDKIAIGITNGDKVPCNMQNLELELMKKSNSSVTIRWSNFRRNLKQTNHLLNYEVYYKEAEKNVSAYDDRDPCGHDDWKVIDVPKMEDFPGLQEQEPQWEEEKLINNLKYFTRYAIYVKTVIIPDQSSPNNNSGAQSEIRYFTTLPFEPSPPQDLILRPNSSNEINLSWQPPSKPNGELIKYIIKIKERPEDVNDWEKHDSCAAKRPDRKPIVPIVPTQPVTPMPSLFGPNNKEFLDANGEKCCSCSSGSSGKEPPAKTTVDARIKQEQLAEAVEHSIFDSIYIADPNFQTPDDEINLTDERKRKRRRRSPQDIDASNDSEEQKIFPKKLPATGRDNYIQDFLIKDYSEIAVIHLNETKDTKFTIRNLTHFTRYSIVVIACRNKSDEITHDNLTCSEPVESTIRTLPLAIADNVDPKSISINVTGSQMKLHWNEPSKPNGIVLAYRLKVIEVNAGKTNAAPYEKCINRKEYHEKGGNYSFPDHLGAGNYSLRIMSISLWAESNYTTETFFIIEATGGGLNTTHILAIVLPILCVIMFLILLGFYYIRNRGVPGRFIVSANPEYMQNIDIPDEWEVSRDKVELLRELGQGSFGMVYEGVVRDFFPAFPKLKCAIKTLPPDAPGEDLRKFLQEALIMTQMSCHHVVELLAVVSKTHPTFVIMELMQLGDLKKYLRSRRPEPPYNNGDPPPTLRQILRMAAEIADGMAYLESKKMVHRDLAARNCMVNENCVVKIGDFGMTKDVLETDYYRKSTRGLLPVRWMAPESIRDGVFTNHSDVWSYGVVLWEMATLAAQPYSGLSNEQVLRYVRDAEVMERPENCPDILYTLMSRCWEFKPLDRPTFIDIIQILLPDLDSSFSQISFYHSPKGMEYRSQSRSTPTQEEITVFKTPLLAKFDDDLLDDDFDDDICDSDEHDHVSVHPFKSLEASQSEKLLPMTTGSSCNGGPGYTISPLKTLNSNINTNNAKIISSNNNNNRSNPVNSNTTSTNNTTSFVSVNLNGLGNNVGDSNYSVSASKYPPSTAGSGNNAQQIQLQQQQNSGQQISNSNCPSNESSKALSINYSSDSGGSNGNGNKGNGNSTSGGASNAVNGYVTLRNTPVDNYQKNRILPL